MGSVVSTMFCKAKSATKKKTKKHFFLRAAIFDNFQTKIFQSETTSFHFFSQGFRISKNIGHPIPGSGGKKRFKRYLKSEHTDRRTNRRTHRQTDISTYRKHHPEGRCFEKALGGGIVFLETGPLGVSVLLETGPRVLVSSLKHALGFSVLLAT